MGKFNIGDRVIFRLGERGNWECSNCGYEFFGSDGEDLMKSFSGKEVNITGFRPLDALGISLCDKCLSDVDGVGGTVEINRLYWAYESELTPIDQPNPIIKEGRFR